MCVSFGEYQLDIGCGQLPHAAISSVLMAEFLPIESVAPRFAYHTPDIATTLHRNGIGETLLFVSETLLQLVGVCLASCRLALPRPRALAQDRLAGCATTETEVISQLFEQGGEQSGSTFLDERYSENISVLPSVLEGRRRVLGRRRSYARLRGSQ